VNAAYEYMKLVISGTDFQRHGDGPDENTSPFNGLHDAALPEDNLFIKHHCRVYYSDRYDKKKKQMLHA